MKKKKATAANDSSSVLDLKSLICQHSLFFDKLVELIPAKFYLPTDDVDKPWFQGLSKAAKASAKKESKQNIKKARRARLDPEKSSTSTLDLLKQSLEKEKLKEESDDDETETNPILSNLDDDNRKVTYEELRQRLHRRIEECRAGRNLGVSNRERKRNERNERSERYEKKGMQDKKRKRDNEIDETTRKSSNPVNADVEKDVAEASKELAFSHVKLGDEEELGKKRKRKLSKLQELERAKKLEEAKKDPEQGEIISKKHSWMAATNRAAGIKVHDDPKLLNKSIQKEKKRHQKNAEKWKERIETTEKMKAERQQKRSDNISNKKQEKKMKKIARREKKLMRPGFEGRKDGFINENPA